MRYCKQNSYKMWAGWHDRGVIGPRLAPFGPFGGRFAGLLARYGAGRVNPGSGRGRVVASCGPNPRGNSQRPPRVCSV